MGVSFFATWQGFTECDRLKLQNLKNPFAQNKLHFEEGMTKNSCVFEYFSLYDTFYAKLLTSSPLYHIKLWIAIATIFYERVPPARLHLNCSALPKKEHHRVFFFLALITEVIPTL